MDGRDGVIANFLFGTFHGGNDPGWALRRRDGGYADVGALFDNIAVYPGERVRVRPGF